MNGSNPYQAPATDDLAPSAGVVPLFRSQEGQATLLVGLLAGLAVLQAVAAYSTHLEIDLLGRMQAGTVTEAEVDGNDQRQRAIGILIMGLYIVTIIVFARFLYRANNNARALSGPNETFRFTPGWTVGWFFVPFANLWKPYQAVKELWSKSRPSVPGMLVLWWVVWLIDNFLSRAANRRSKAAETLPALLDADRLTMISEVFGIVSAVVALMLIRSIHADQQHHHETGQPRNG